MESTNVVQYNFLSSPELCYARGYESVVSVRVSKGSLYEDIEIRERCARIDIIRKHFFL